jgi:hypothetical protein
MNGHNHLRILKDVEGKHLARSEGAVKSGCGLDSSASKWLSVRFVCEHSNERNSLSHGMWCYADW